MDEQYWHEKGESYDEEILDVRATDREDVVEREIRELADPRAAAIDFGCGPGKFLPLLARCFRKVRALDFSETCLEQARTSCGSLANVAFRKTDMTCTRTRLRRARFGLCVNALITDSLSRRQAMFRFIARHLEPGGHLVLVVPSLESALYCSFREVQWETRESPQASSKALIQKMADFDRTEGAAPELGLVQIDGVPTKHFLREELQVLLAEQGFKPVAFKKVEYDWDVEFESPPDWLKHPYPWHWLVTAQRTA